MCRGGSRGGRLGGSPPLKTYEINFFHHDFVQFDKQHSQYKAILPSFVWSQQCCEAYFSSLTVAKLLWDLTTKYYLNRPPDLTGWIRPCFCGLTLLERSCASTWNLLLLFFFPAIRDGRLGEHVSCWSKYFFSTIWFCLWYLGCNLVENELSIIKTCFDNLAFPETTDIAPNA